MPAGNSHKDPNKKYRRRTVPAKTASWIKSKPKSAPEPKPSPPPAPAAPKQSLPPPAVKPAAPSAPAPKPPPPAAKPASTKLPLPQVPLARDDAWRMFGRSSGKGKLSIHKDALRVEYVAGEVGSASGITFHAKPTGFPKSDVTLRYQVFFSKDFDFKEGGKLPGIFIGGAGAAAGNWSDDSGSARVVFKQGGAAVAYIYVPTQVCDQDRLDAVQGTGFAAVANHTEKGTHVWRDGVTRFKTDSWNDVAIHVKLNSGKERDGILGLEINGVRKELPFMWRTNPKLEISGIAFSTFFGGSTKAASAPKDAYTEFRNFSF
jgi:hypothetical protein